MKAFRVLSALLVFALLLCGCMKRSRPPEREKNLSSTYVFSEVSYLSPLSSSTWEYRQAVMSGTIYTITADTFSWQNRRESRSISVLQYVKEPASQEARNLLGVRELEQYTLYAEGGPAYLRLYIAGEKVWVSSYIIAPGNGEDLFSYIYLLEKVET